MNRQSHLMPQKAEIVFDNKEGKPYKKPRIEKEFTQVNKGKVYPYGSKRQGFESSN